MVKLFVVTTAVVETDAPEADGVDDPLLNKVGHVLVLHDDDDGRDDEEDDGDDEDLHHVELFAHLFARQQDVAQEETQECRREQKTDQTFDLEI
jgi:hypothetical protein